MCVCCSLNIAHHTINYVGHFAIAFVWLSGSGRRVSAIVWLCLFGREACDRIHPTSVVLARRASLNKTSNAVGTKPTRWFSSVIYLRGDVEFCTESDPCAAPDVTAIRTALRPYELTRTTRRDRWLLPALSLRSAFTISAWMAKMA